jgi:hypothetical protein
MICFSQVVLSAVSHSARGSDVNQSYQYCKKLVAMRSSSSISSSFLCRGTAFLLAPWEWERLDKGAGLDGRAWTDKGLLVCDS